MATAGYSGTPLPKKLGIKEGTRLAVVHAPDGFDATLGELPPEAQRLSRLRPGLDVVIGFFTARDALEREWAKLTAAVAPAGTCALVLLVSEREALIRDAATLVMNDA